MITATCSWCHAINTIDGLRVYCLHCGHRADVCRLACDCDVCLRQTYRSGNYPYQLPPNKPRGKYS